MQTHCNVKLMLNNEPRVTEIRLWRVLLINRSKLIGDMVRNSQYKCVLNIAE